MTAPTGPTWRDVLIAGMAAYGITVTATCAPPIVCDDCCGEWTCPDGAHLWLTRQPHTSPRPQTGGQP